MDYSFWLAARIILYAPSNAHLTVNKNVLSVSFNKYILLLLQSGKYYHDNFLKLNIKKNIS